MKKLKEFLLNHSNIALYWGNDMWHIIPNITLIYHEYLNGLSFSFEFLKIYFWIEINIRKYQN